MNVHHSTIEYLDTSFSMKCLPIYRIIRQSMSSKDYKKICIHNNKYSFNIIMYIIRYIMVNIAPGWN